MQIFNLKPTYYFGKDSLEGVILEIKKHHFKNPLILCGKGSIKKLGLYDQLTFLLQKNNINFESFFGIEPNPRSTTIDEVINFCYGKNIDVIIAFGGGSVVDASKVIASLINNRSYKNSWEYVMEPLKFKLNNIIPIISIITLAGTASENNGGSVITNAALKEKFSVSNPENTPIASIENPEFTYSVNSYQTASGIFDCFSHLLEQYFAKETFEWSKQMIFANLRVLLLYAKTAIDKPNDYEARANILWTTSMALNGMTNFGSDSDWSVHQIEHALSGLWDIAHGAGLALITPYYLLTRGNKEQWFYDKVVELGKNVFNVNTFDETLEYIKNFILNVLKLFDKWNQFVEIKKFDENDLDFLMKHISKKNQDKDLLNIYHLTLLAIQKNI